MTMLLKNIIIKSQLLLIGGYDCYKLIKYNLKNNILFVSRITKTNTFINNLENNKNSSLFTITINNKNDTLQIIKYTNIQKPDINETKN